MGEHKQKEKLLADAMAEIKQFNRPMCFELEVPRVMQLVSALQLALRHPTYVRHEGSRFVQTFVTEIIAALPPEMAATKKLLSMGSDPQFDEKREPRKCRVCGCTDERACATPEGPCYWVEPDLCSACAPAAKSLITP